MDILYLQDVTVVSSVYLIQGYFLVLDAGWFTKDAFGLEKCLIAQELADDELQDYGDSELIELLSKSTLTNC